MYIRLIVALLVVSSFVSNAQNVQNLGVGAGGAYITVRDEGISVLNYHNFGAGIGSYFESYRNSVYNRLLLDVSYAKAMQGMTNVGILHTGKVDLLYSHFFRLKKPSETAFYIGGSIGITGGYRYQPFFLNSAHNYDISNPIGFSFLANHNFTIFNKGMSLQYWFDIPLIAAVLKPAYASPLPDGLQNFEVELQDGYLRSIRILTLNRYTRFRNQISLQIPLTEKNQLRISYDWDFYRILHQNPLYFSGHNFNLLYVFGLGRKA
ncbi:MAG: hypothetical protein H0X62_02415 [Bacteroidetes bacterium]|nr:hypothetical protein [Bacteroidota bacterium]